MFKLLVDIPSLEVHLLILHLIKHLVIRAPDGTNPLSGVPNINPGVISGYLIDVFTGDYRLAPGQGVNFRIDATPTGTTTNSPETLLIEATGVISGDQFPGAVFLQVQSLI